MLTAQQASLRQLRIVLAAAILIPILLFAYTAWSSYQAAFQLADRQIARARDALQEHASKVFETVDQCIDLVSEIVAAEPNDRLRQKEAQLHQRLKQIIAKTPQVKSIFVLDEQGRAIANSLASPPPDIDLQDRDYFQTHLRNGPAFFLGDVLQPRPPYGGDSFFAVSRARHGRMGAFEGVIEISVLPRYFEEFYRRLATQDGFYFALVRSDGAVLARHPAADGPLAVQADIGGALPERSEIGWMTHVSVADQLERRITTSKIANYPVYVLAGLETQAVRAAWLRYLSSYFAFGLPAAGALIAIIFLVQSRTRRLYAEASKRHAAEAALRQSQRLEALGQLTGGVAHDFNNLLMIITGSVQQLRTVPDGAKRVRALDMIETASKRAESLTRKLLAFARRRTLTPRLVDLGNYILEFDDILRRSLRADIIVKLEGLTDYLAATVDQDELEIALLNLAVNARDAMPDGGTLTVALGSRSYPRSEGPDGLTGDFVTISVSDTGGGIPLENRSKIFEPFFTTKPAGQGTGLGLSQVYGFARQSGGTLTVQSEPGRGATFVLHLPRSRERANAMLETLPDRTAARSGSRVLLVEDNPEVAQIARQYLEQLGYEVSHAVTVEEALRALRDSAVFSLVLSDIVMPGGLSGLDLARVIRDQHGGLPVILSTGYSDKSTQAVQDGFVVLSKPYSLPTLIRAIEGVLSAKVSAAE